MGGLSHINIMHGHLYMCRYTYKVTNPKPIVQYMGDLSFRVLDIFGEERTAISISRKQHFRTYYPFRKNEKKKGKKRGG